MRHRTFSVAVVTVGMLVLAHASAQDIALAGDDVPLKGSATATFQYHDPASKTSYFSLAGNSTHLGLLSGTAAVLFEYEPVPHPVGALVHMVAANGDTLDLATNMAGQSYVIVDGTGRFDGATGSGSFVATGSGEVSLVWDGTIDFKED